MKKMLTSVMVDFITVPFEMYVSTTSLSVACLMITTFVGARNSDKPITDLIEFFLEV